MGISYCCIGQLRTLDFYHLYILSTIRIISLPPDDFKHTLRVRFGGLSDLQMAASVETLPLDLFFQKSAIGAKPTVP
jgi:hypothetical protein